VVSGVWCIWCMIQWCLRYDTVWCLVHDAVVSGVVVVVSGADAVVSDVLCSRVWCRIQWCLVGDTVVSGGCTEVPVWYNMLQWRRVYDTVMNSVWNSNVWFMIQSYLVCDRGSGVRYVVSSAWYSGVWCMIQWCRMMIQWCLVYDTVVSGVSYSGVWCMTVSGVWYSGVWCMIQWCLVYGTVVSGVWYSGV